MGSPADTPEALDALFEDAIVLRDRDAVARLFTPTAVVAAEGGPDEVRGPEAIADFVAAAWQRDRTYLADPRRVVQASDLALVMAGQGISVLRRGEDRTWRYAISLLSFEPRAHQEQARDPLHRPTRRRHREEKP